jgi:putative transposase
MSTQRKRGKCFELPLLRYVDGIKLVRLRLLELHPECVDMIETVYSKLCMELESQLSLPDPGSRIVESVPKSKLMILKDKKIFTDPTILTMNWLVILGAVLTLKDEACRPFWNASCVEKSKRLWFPIETDYVDSRSSLSNSYASRMIQNSWFSIKQSINPQMKSSQMMFSQSSMFSHAEKWEKGGIRVRKIKLLLSPHQRHILERWAGTTRYVYNRCLARVKNDSTLNNDKGYDRLRTECITELNNTIIREGTVPDPTKPFLYDWELETPKDIRAAALFDVKKAYKTAFSNLKNGNINHFDLNPRLKKYGNEQSMEVPHTAIKLVRKDGKNKSLRIYPRYMKDPIKMDKRDLYGLNIEKIKHACRLKKENNVWILCIPIDVKPKIDRNKQPKNCAIDPGVRKFAVVYSEDRLTQIITDHDKLKKYTDMMDNLQKMRDRSLIRNQTYKRCRMKIQRKINNLVDDLHHKTTKFLTEQYTDVLLPSYETQVMVRSNKLSKETKRTMMNLSSYKFQQRLIHKGKINGCLIQICNEAFTSQTCGYCGNKKKTSDEIIQCDSCHNKFDRDVNGSRNIYLKHI